MNRPRHRMREARFRPGSTLWWPRTKPEPGFEHRGGTLYSYRYVGRHHPERKP